MPKPKMFLPILLIVISSCTIYKEFPIEILAPGEVSLPNEIQNIAVISANFKYEGDSTIYYFSDKIKSKLPLASHMGLDLLMVNRTLKAFSQTANANGRFKNIEVFPYKFLPVVWGDSLMAFSPGFVRKICLSYNVDAIIALEIISYEYSEYGKINDNIPKSNQVRTAAMWRIYSPKTKAFIDQKVMVDTIYWNVGYTTWTPDKIPPMVEAYGIAAEVTGENYAKRITANWQEVNRMYVVPPVDDFRKGAESFNKGKWDESIDFWEKYADKRYKKLAIHANYNLALAYEMKDDMKKAVECINSSANQAKAIKSKAELKWVNEYKKILVERHKNQTKLSNIQDYNNQILPLNF